MTFTTRLGTFVVIAVAGIVAWQWNASLDGSRDLAKLAVEQFQNGAASERLQEASLAQSYWPLVWPGFLVMLGCVMFWDDVERLWRS